MKILVVTSEAFCNLINYIALRVAVTLIMSQALISQQPPPSYLTILEPKKLTLKRA